MAELEIRPLCRVQPPGGATRFKVRLEGVEGGRLATFAVRPCDQAVDYHAHFADGASTAPIDGGEQVLTVEVPPHASIG